MTSKGNTVDISVHMSEEKWIGDVIKKFKDHLLCHLKTNNPCNINYITVLNRICGVSQPSCWTEVVRAPHRCIWKKFKSVFIFCGCPLRPIPCPVRMTRYPEWRDKLISSICELLGYCNKILRKMQVIPFVKPAVLASGCGSGCQVRDGVHVL